MALLRYLFVLGCLLMLSKSVISTCPENKDFLNCALKENSPPRRVCDINYSISFSTASEQIKALFDANSTGLYLTKPFDLDGQKNKALCDLSSSLDFYVKCNDVDQADDIRIGIQTEYTDDFPPSFGKTSYVVHAAEERNYQSLIQFKENVNAFDDDCQSQFSFSIQPSSDTDTTPFAFDQFNDIFVNTSLDYERQQEYLLNISVLTTVNDQRKRAYTKLIVIVDDVDDRYPEFIQPMFEIFVDEMENMSEAWLLTTPPIHADDGDIGVNTTILYSIAKPVPYLDAEINSTTGQIKINEILDRNKIPSYQITVKAYQADKDFKSTEATLIIQVKDINDHPPIFSSLEYTIDLMENSAKGTWILALHVTDLDEGDNAMNKLSITGKYSSAFALKQPTIGGDQWLILNDTDVLIGGTTANITIKAIPVTELIDVSCDYIKTCVTHVKVNILSTNVNSPQFNQLTYDFNLLQLNAGYAVGKVSANDADNGTFGNVTYKIKNMGKTDVCAGVFDINSVSGEITIAKDVNQSLSCILGVEACDNPVKVSERLCSVVAVQIKVSLLETDYDVYIPENAPNGTTVLELPTDNLKVNSQTFEIKSRSLVTVTSLDRESTTAYNLSITANNTEKIMSTVHVFVSDVNDNAPVPVFSIYNASLTGLDKDGFPITTIQATDKDEGINKEVKYYLLNHGDWLSIEENTGVISLLKMPQHNINNDMKEVLVKIEDSGLPPLSSIGRLHIYFSSTNASSTVILPLPRSQVLTEQAQITKSLSSLLGVKIKIQRVKSVADVEDIGSIVYLTAVSLSDSKEVIPSELTKLLTSNAQDIYNLFYENKSDESDEDIETFKILFIIAACLFGIAVIALLAVACFHRRMIKRNAHQLSIIKTLNHDTKIYDETGKENGGNTISRNGIRNGKQTTRSEYAFSNPTFTNNDVNDNSIATFNNVESNESSTNAEENTDIIDPTDSLSASHEIEPSINTTSDPVQPFVSTINIESPVQSLEQAFENVHSNNSEIENNNSSITSNLSLPQDPEPDYTAENRNMSNNRNVSQSSLVLEDPEPDYAKVVRFDSDSDKADNSIHRDSNGNTVPNTFDFLDTTAATFL